MVVRLPPCLQTPTLGQQLTATIVPGNAAAAVAAAVASAVVVVAAAAAAAVVGDEIGDDGPRHPLQSPLLLPSPPPRPRPLPLQDHHCPLPKQRCCHASPGQWERYHTRASTASTLVQPCRRYCLRHRRRQCRCALLPAPPSRSTRQSQCHLLAWRLVLLLLLLLLKLSVESFPCQHRTLWSTTKSGVWREKKRVLCVVCGTVVEKHTLHSHSLTLHPLSHFTRSHTAEVCFYFLLLPRHEESVRFDMVCFVAKPFLPHTHTPKKMFVWLAESPLCAPHSQARGRKKKNQLGVSH